MSRDNGLYLDDVIDALTAIQSYSLDMDQITFLQDQKTTHACMSCFQIVGEAVKKLPASWKESEASPPTSSTTCP